MDFIISMHYASFKTAMVYDIIKLSLLSVSNKQNFVLGKPYCRTKIGHHRIWLMNTLVFRLSCMFYSETFLHVIFLHRHFDFTVTSTSVASAYFEG